MSRINVRHYAEADRAWVEALLERMLGGHVQARRGELVDVLTLPGFIAQVGDQAGGFLSYDRIGRECELAAVVALQRHQGVGSALLEALRAEVADCSRIWLVTTNDNVDALRFYQRRGFTLRALRPTAVDDARRRLKPTIPVVGAYGIPLRDELELELILPG